MGRRSTKRAALRAAAPVTPAAPAATPARMSYDAAGQGPRIRSWRPGNLGPNRAIRGLQAIRDRSRDSGRNDWVGAAVTERWTVDLVGTGIIPRPHADLRDSHRKLLADEFDTFSGQVDANGVYDVYGLEALITRTVVEAGECFVRLRWREIDYSELAVPLQLQIIEPEMVPLLDADQWPGLPANNRIRSGIELDRRDRIVAYWCHRSPPNDDPGKLSPAPSAQDLVRVLARDMLHVYRPLRAGTLRGVPWVAPALVRMRNTGDWEDAGLERHKLANLVTGFIHRKAAGIDGDDPTSPVNPLTGALVETDAPNTEEVALEPGQMFDIGDNDVTFSNPPAPHATHSEYLRSQHLGTAAGAGPGIPYELLTGDIRDVSDRALRIMVNQYRRAAEQVQWQVLIPQFCRRMYAAFVDALILVGRLPRAAESLAKRPDWAPHGWAYIHPVQDAQGKKLEVEVGFRSRSSVIAERGDDPVRVDEERAADQERATALGIAPPAAPDRPQIRPIGPTTNSQRAGKNEQHE